jgi:RNA polymerase sigma factor (sigma-70 family)
MKKETLFKEDHIQNLILEHKNGNKQAFVEIWKAINPYVYRIMRSDLDEDTAKSLTSEVCTRLFDGGLLQYQPQSGISFISWVRKMAHGIKIDEFRRRRPIPFSDLENGEEDKRIIPDCRSPISILIEEEEDDYRKKVYELVSKLLESFTPEEQYIIHASFFDGKTDKEIAMILMCDENYANKYRVMRQRVLGKLEEMLKKYGIRDIPIRK